MRWRGTVDVKRATSGDTLQAEKPGRMPQSPSPGGVHPGGDTRKVSPSLAAACAAAALAAMAGGVACSPREKSLKVFFTGGSACELELCVCGGEMIGGIARRGGFFARHKGERLLLDTGCVGCGVRPDDILRCEAMLRGMAAMKYDAANLGEYELWLGAERLRKLARVGVPFVSANVTDAGGGLVGAPYLVLTRAGVRAAVTGVVEKGAFREAADVSVADPMEALARVLPEMARGADAVIVLADLREPRAREVARRFPEVSLVLFRGRGDTLAAERENRSYVASVAGLGRYVGEVVLATGAKGRLRAESKVHRIDKTIPPDEGVAEASLKWYERAENSGRRVRPSADHK